METIYLTMEFFSILISYMCNISQETTEINNQIKTFKKTKNKTVN